MESNVMLMMAEGIDEKFAEYLELRLQEWAKWYSNDYSGLGYPSCSLEYRMMTEGVLINSTSPRQVLSNYEAEEIEALVSGDMFKQNSRMALALQIHYFKKRKSRDRSNELDVSATRFRIYVDMAKQWLAGRLSERVHRKNSR
jgi:hypothetical protein